MKAAGVMHTRLEREIAVASERRQAIQEEKRLAKLATDAEKARVKAEKDEPNKHKMVLDSGKAVLWH